MVDRGNHGFVVIDTAPTGHTLLLLDAANAYHRDVERNLSYIPDSVRRLLPHLRDPKFTKVLIVVLPEATPVHEASRLQSDLLRAGITPFGWVMNQCFGGTLTRDPILSKRAELERPYVNEVKKLTKHLYLLPLATGRTSRSRAFARARRNRRNPTIRGLLDERSGTVL